MTELEEALLLANRILDRPNADPDDDLAMLARQLVRREEAAERCRQQIIRMAEERHLLHGRVEDAFWSCSRLCCQQASRFLRGEG